MRMLSALVGLIISFASVVASAESYSEGNGYVTLAEQVRPADPTRIEVNEVFSYYCPHCFHFEPLLVAWTKKQAADVNLVQTHASFVANWPIYQRGYYTVLALGMKDKTQEAIFNAIHVNRKELNDAQAWADFLSIYGVDKQKTLSTFNSFGVNSQVKQADTRVRDLKVTSTPQIIVDGRFRITAKNHEDMLKVADFLVAKIRAERAAMKH
jgi:protein dithiol oxidoreductase (disulfide-forming)